MGGNPPVKTGRGSIPLALGKPMRILSVTAQKPHSTGSGVYLTETVRAFAQLGHENAVVAGVCAGDAGVCAGDAVFFPERVRVYPVYYNSDALPFPVCGMSDEMPYESTVYRSMSEDMVAQFERAFSSVIEKAVNEFKPDVLLCHHLYLLTAIVRELCRDIPVWGMCHGSDLRQLYTNGLCRERIIASVAGLDKLCCLHDAQREQIIELFGVPPEKVRVVGTGYSSRVFYDRGLRQPHRERRLIYAGKISEKKGVYSLISALALLGWRREDFSLRMAGGWGDETQHEKALTAIGRSGWDITLLGRLSQDALAEEYSKADIFILPSFYEGLPLVLAEAMACGTRVVCTELPGIKPWMDSAAPDNGIVFVAPPRMTDADTPVEDSLPDFETRLAAAIQTAAAQPIIKHDLSALTWTGVCKKILE